MSSTSKVDNEKDFDWAFGLNRLSLGLMGVWPSDNRADNFARSVRIPLMMTAILFGVLSPQVFALTKVYRHLPLVIDNLTNSTSALVSIVKLFMVWYRRKVLHLAIRQITSDWLSEKSSWERNLMLKQAFRARLFTISGYAIIFGCVLGYTISPLFGLSIRELNNITDLATTRRHFPVQSSYPYAVEKSPAFELTYATQMLGSACVGVAFCIPENFFGALVFHASARCEILVGKFAEALVLCRGDDEGLRLRLRTLVRMHVELISFVNAIESSFSVLVLSHVVCLTIIIACMAYSFISYIGGKGETPSLIQVLTLVSSIVTLMTHMFVFCLTSEILSGHSCRFVDAVYDVNSSLLPPKFARDVVIIMTCSRSPLRLTAGKFFYLSLNAYLQFVKNTGAYVSMLLAVNK